MASVDNLILLHATQKNDTITLCSCRALIWWWTQRFSFLMDHPNISHLDQWANSMVQKAHATIECTSA